MMFRATLDPPITDQANDIENVWDLYLWLSVAVLALVVILMLFIVIRFRRRDNNLPRQTHQNIPMEVTYTVVPLLVVLGLFAITVVSLGSIEKDNDNADLIVHVTAFQWQWQFDYPDSNVSIVGGPGDDVPELVLPASSSVRFELESLDVVHSFWLTPFRFKRDIIPGRPGTFSVDITDSPGWYPNAGVCAEYCGLDHTLMQFSLRVLEPDEFSKWLAETADLQEVGS